jgi:hypothetical protein
MLHQLRSEATLDSYDTVFDVFDEGDPAYPGIRVRVSRKRHTSSLRSETQA